MRTVRRKKNNSTTKKVQHQERNIHQLIKRLLQSLMIVKLYHWNTGAYSVHKATDKLYNVLNTNIDRLVEVLLGKHNTVNKNNVLKIHTLEMKTFKHNSDFLDWLGQLKNYLMDIDTIFFSERDSDILSIRDEILADLNKISYLLSLQ